MTLQWGRDVTVADRFTVRHQRKVVVYASMGPRRYRRGSRVKLGPVDKFVYQLQWGRDVTVADRVMAWPKGKPRSPGFNGAATLPSRIASR